MVVITHPTGVLDALDRHYPKGSVIAVGPGWPASRVKWFLREGWAQEQAQEQKPVETGLAQQNPVATGENEQQPTPTDTASLPAVVVPSDRPVFVPQSTELPQSTPPPPVPPKHGKGKYKSKKGS